MLDSAKPWRCASRWAVPEAGCDRHIRSSSIPSWSSPCLRQTSPLVVGTWKFGRPGRCTNSSSLRLVACSLLSECASDGSAGPITVHCRLPRIADGQNRDELRFFGLGVRHAWQLDSEARSRPFFRFAFLFFHPSSFFPFLRNCCQCDNVKLLPRGRFKITVVMYFATRYYRNF